MSMPIYEYECEKCHTTFEMIQSISASPLKKHMENGCNGKVQRLVSASGFILKGSGWYATDYPSESRKQGWDQESKQANCGATEAPAKTETPAPAAAEAKPAKPKPAVKKPAAKSPYAGAKKKKAKTSK